MVAAEDTEAKGMTTMRIKTNAKAGGVMNHNQTSVKAPRVKSMIKAGRSVDPGGGGEVNHNQTTVRSREGLRVRTKLKAGTGPTGENYNETSVRSRKAPRVKSSVRAGHIGGSLGYNHNQTTVRAVRVKSTVQAGGVTSNHNQTAVRTSERLRVRSNVRAGIGVPADNHNVTMLCATRTVLASGD